MEIDNELTFDMIGNVSDEGELEKEITTEEIVEEDAPLFTSEEEEEDSDEEGVILESVDEEDQGGELPETIDEDGSVSPNFYASIADSLKKDGFFTLDDSDWKDIESADGLAELFQKQVDALLDSKQKRIDEALNNNIPVDTVKQYEQVLSYVESITESSLKEETPEGEQLRGNLICQDFMNKGFSQERANKEVKKSFEAGTDVEDSLEALTEVKSFYKEEYENILETSKEEKKSLLDKERENSKKLEDLFLKTEEPIKGVKLTENERKKVLKQYTKFVSKDSKENPLNAVQSYAYENPLEYQYNINLLYYLTNGFKDMGTVLQKGVNKKTKSTLSNLEKTLRNPNTQLGGGGLNFDNDKSPDSYKGINVVLD